MFQLPIINLQTFFLQVLQFPP